MTTNENPGAAPPAGDGTAPPAGDAPAASGSLFDGVQPGAGAPAGDPAAAPPAAAPTGDDWLPEKYRVNDADGKLDEAASSRKLADAYRALESKLGNAAALPPASPDDYTLEAPKDAEGKPIEGFDVAEFTGDPLFKAFAKDAHAQGITQPQLQFVVERYLKLAPELIAADKAVTLQEAKAELGTLWKDEGAMRAGLADAMRAITAFGAEAEDVPGSRARLQERFATDPDFAAFAASVAKELKEDSVPAGQAVSSEMDIEAMQSSPAYWTPSDPQHKIVKAKVDEFYAKKYGNKRR